MQFSIIHMVKKSAYYNRTLTPVLMAITSANICDFHLSHHNQLPLNGVVYINHFSNSDYNICHKAI